MNKATIKAINKAKEDDGNKPTVRRWWSKNAYKVWRVVLFPLWLVVLLKRKINDWLYYRVKWNDNRAYEILSYYVPRVAEYAIKTQEFVVRAEDLYSTVMIRDEVKLKDKRFCYKYRLKLVQYFVEKFELDGFKKNVSTVAFDTVVVFKMKEEEVKWQ